MKQNCLISRLDEPNIAHLYVIEWDQNLINNIRVLCTRNPETLKYFVPEELFWKLKNGEAVPMAAECYDEYGIRLFAVDPLKVLSEQAGVEEDDPAGVDGLEIRLRIDGYAPAQPSDEILEGVLARPVRYRINRGTGGAGRRSSGARNTNDRAERAEQSEDVTFRRRRKMPVKEIVLAAIIMAAAACVWLLRDTSVKRFEDRLEASNYKEAVNIYNEEIFGHESREEKADPQVREAVEDVRDRYMAESCGYEDACAYLNILAGIDKKDLSELAQSSLDEVVLYEASSETIREGTVLMEEQEYLKAIEVFLRVDESSTMYDQAREDIDDCVSGLVKSGADAGSEEECLEAMAGIDEGLKLLPENGDLTESRDACMSKYQSLVRGRVIAEADGLAAKGDYAGAFKRLNAGMEVLAEDEQLGQKVFDLRKEFVDHVTGLALGRVDSGDFSEAEELVEKSLEIYPCGEFDELIDQIEETEEWSAPKSLKYRAGKITYSEYPGAFTDNNKKNEFTVKAEESGTCVWEFTRMESALKVRLIVRKPDGTEAIKEKDLVDGSKVFCDMDKDQEYTVEVTALEGEGGYVLLLGQNKAAADISAYDSVTDSIEYKGQSNSYIYTPEVTGTYRFDVDTVSEDLPVKLEIYDSKDSKAGGGEIKEGNGFTANMTEGGKYRIEACSSGIAGEYTFSIGKPETSEDVTGRHIICGAVTYPGQKKSYTFKAERSGKYRITVGNMERGNRVKIYLYSSLGDKIGGADELGNGEHVTAEFDEGQGYQLQLTQISGTGEYTITVARE